MSDTQPNATHLLGPPYFYSLYKRADGTLCRTLCPGGDPCDGECKYFMSSKQHEALWNLCERYGVPFFPLHYAPQFDLPEGYLAGWVGGPAHATADKGGNRKPTIYVGCSLNGEISS